MIERTVRRVIVVTIRQTIVILEALLFRRTLSRVLGSRIGPHYRLVAFLHLQLARCIFRLFGKTHCKGLDLAAIARFRYGQQGWVLLSGRDLPRSISDKFAEAKFLKSTESVTQLDRSDLLSLSRDLGEMLESVSPVISAYYGGSSFRICDIDGMRSFASECVPRSLSYLWHHDFVSDYSLKLFVYGNDQDSNGGATRMFDFESTKRILKRGFDTNRREKHQRIVESEPSSNVHVMEGKSGDILIWRNNLLHIATLPQSGHRDLISIEISPSLFQFSAGDVEKFLRSEFGNPVPKALADLRRTF